MGQLQLINLIDRTPFASSQFGVESLAFRKLFEELACIYHTFVVNVPEKEAFCDYKQVALRQIKVIFDTLQTLSRGLSELERRGDVTLSQAQSDEMIDNAISVVIQFREGLQARTQQNNFSKGVSNQLYASLGDVQTQLNQTKHCVNKSRNKLKKEIVDATFEFFAGFEPWHRVTTGLVQRLRPLYLLSRKKQPIWLFRWIPAFLKKRIGEPASQQTTVSSFLQNPCDTEIDKAMLPWYVRWFSPRIVRHYRLQQAQREQVLRFYPELEACQRELERLSSEKVSARASMMMLEYRRLLRRIQAFKEVFDNCAERDKEEIAIYKEFLEPVFRVGEQHSNDALQSIHSLKSKLNQVYETVSEVVIQKINERAQVLGSTLEDRQAYRESQRENASADPLLNAVFDEEGKHFVPSRVVAASIPSYEPPAVSDDDLVVSQDTTLSRLERNVIECWKKDRCRKGSDVKAPAYLIAEKPLEDNDVASSAPVRRPADKERILTSTVKQAKQVLKGVGVRFFSKKPEPTEDAVPPPSFVNPHFDPSAARSCLILTEH